MARSCSTLGCPLLFHSASIAALAFTSAACRDAPTPDGGLDYGNVAVRDLQSDHPDDEDPVLGSEVYLRSVVVTAFDSYAEPEQDRVQRGSEYLCLQDVGYSGGMVVQDFEGGPFSGVSLFNPQLVPAHHRLGPGDLEFCLAGEDYHADSYCQAPNTNRLTQLGAATATKVGEASPPLPYQVSSADLRSPQRAEPFEGVLVLINERISVEPCVPADSRGRPNCCVGDYDRYGNLATNAVALTNDFWSVPEGTRCFTSVAGIVTWFGHQSEFGDYTISPRGPDDVVIPEECRGR
jgi:hypothetical protein